MQNRPLAVFLLCFGVVAGSGVVALVAADSWLHEPGAQLFGVRTPFLIWVVVLLVAPVLAAVSAHFLSVSAGLGGTLAGAAAVASVAGGRPPMSAMELLAMVFFAAGIVGVPVTAEFGIVVTLRRVWGPRADPAGPSS